MEKDKIKTIRRIMREERLENPEAYNRAQAYDDRRNRRCKTRRAQLQQAIKEYEDCLDEYSDLETNNE